MRPAARLQDQVGHPESDAKSDGDAFGAHGRGRYPRRVTGLGFPRDTNICRPLNSWQRQNHNHRMRVVWGPYAPVLGTPLGAKVVTQATSGGQFIVRPCYCAHIGMSVLAKRT